MVFTYNPASPGQRDRVRLRIADTDSAAPIFSDEELDILLADAGTSGKAQVYLAAAEACRSAQAKRIPARGTIATPGGATISRDGVADGWAALAEEYERRAGALAGVDSDRLIWKPEDEEQIEIEIGAQAWNQERPWPDE